MATEGRFRGAPPTLLQTQNSTRLVAATTMSVNTLRPRHRAVQGENRWLWPCISRATTSSRFCPTPIMLGREEAPERALFSNKREFGETHRW